MPAFVSPTVMKFGGTSVEDAAAFARAAQLVADEQGRAAGRGVVVIVSAMGRVTDALLGATRAAAEEESAPSVGETIAAHLERHFARHDEVARALLADEEAARFAATLARAREELAELLRQVGAGQMPRLVLQDVIVSYGERLSAALFAAILNRREITARDVDARRCVVTDDEHTRAAPLFDLTRERTRGQLMPLLAQGVVPVLGGFIGATRAGATTTLGRGGSDYSAALIGAAVDAAEVQIWTDVSGVLTADPRVVPGARTVARLSYAEAAELAYFGAKVLHPKTIQPAVERQIPVRVCNSRAPASGDTLVCVEGEVSPLAVKAIAHKGSLILFQVTAARMLGAYGFLRAVFEVFERHRTAVDVVATSEVSISLTIDDSHALDQIAGELRQLGAVEVKKNQAIVCVVGEGIRHTPGVAARVFNQISDINVSLISQGASSVNLTFVVDEPRAPEVVARLHESFFGAK